jgi:5-methylcytosine-specific restriction endonuclease McrA
MDKNKFRSSAAWKHKRAEILKRDHNMCKICCNEEGLQVHHIYSLDTHWQLRLDDNNLITLCEQCHHAAHNAIFNPVFLLNKIK